MKSTVSVIRRIPNYKRILFILILTMTFTLISCEKIEKVPLGTITVLIDGKTRSFNTAAKAENLDVVGGYGISIHGYRADEGASNNILISIASPNRIAETTYTNYSSGNAVRIEYNVNFIFFWEEYVSSSATVSIYEISSTSVRGTFSGTLSSGETTVELKKGVFNVSF